MSEFVIEVMPTDISAYRSGNTGIEYVHRLDSGRPGPTVVVNALTHGNEICGAYAVKLLFEKDIRPKQGALILSFANVAAYESFDPDNPTASRFIDEDFNRLWDPSILDGDRDSAELSRARTFREIVIEADYLLDIHSMQSLSPALMLCGTEQKGKDLALRVGVPANIVADAGHKAGWRMRDYGGFSDSASDSTALLVECGQHWLQAAVDCAIDTTFRFLLATETIGADVAAAHVSTDPPNPRVIDVSGPVTISDDSFRFVEDFQGMEVIAKAGTVIGYDGDTAIETPYDDCVLIMPSRRLQKGQSAVRFGRIVG